MKIKLIAIGHVDNIIDFKHLQNFKSKFFKFSSIESILSLPSSSIETGYLDIVYSKEDIYDIIHHVQFDGICLVIMPYYFDDAFYMHRLDNNKVCISIAGIEEILSKKDISIENFIIKSTYEIFLFHKVLNNLIHDEVYDFVHQDTRKCLFDLNGDKEHIIYNTEQPGICDECKSKIKKKPLENGFIKEFEKELLRIKKPFLKSLELFIKRYPLLSIILTIVFSISINLTSNFIWQLLK